MSHRPSTSLDGFHNTAAAQRADLMVRSFFASINSSDFGGFQEVVARNFQSYSPDGLYSRTRTRERHANLHRSFSDLRFEVHENVGVIVEDDLIALRTVLTGTHTGEFNGLAPTARRIQTSVGHVFRFQGDRLVEHWYVADTYRILVAIGSIPGVASLFQRMLGVEESPGGLFVEKAGTAFDGPREGRLGTREESRAVSRRLYDGVIATGRAQDVGALAEDYIQNTGWTPDGRANFGKAWSIGRSAMPDGRAVQTHVVAENDRVASISIWDGTVSQRSQAVDFRTVDFLRVENGVAAEHWDSVDYVSLYQCFGLLPEKLKGLRMTESPSSL